MAAQEIAHFTVAALFHPQIPCTQGCHGTSELAHRTGGRSAQVSAPANFRGTRALIEPANAAMLLIDYQSGLFQNIGDVPMPVLCANLTTLAQAATVAGIPVITTASSPQSPSGALIPEIRKYAPHAQYVARYGEINAWDNPGSVRRWGRPESGN